MNREKLKTYSLHNINKYKDGFICLDEQHYQEFFDEFQKEFQEETDVKYSYCIVNFDSYCDYVLNVLNGVEGY